MMMQVHLNEKEYIAILKPSARLSESDFNSARDIIDPFIDNYEKLNGIIIYVETFSGWDSFGALISHLKFINGYHKKISKVAIVTNSMVGEFAQDIGKHFITAEIKHFDFTDLEKAKKWIASSKK
jgi:hypothetical protein